MINLSEEDSVTAAKIVAKECDWNRVITVKAIEAGMNPDGITFNLQKARWLARIMHNFNLSPLARG